MKIDYQLHNLELAEYTRLLPKHTDLDFIVYIDESSSYRRWNHPSWLIISNDDPYTELWIAMSIEAEPKIFVGDLSLLPDSQRIQIRQFIAIFHEVLLDIANEVVDSEAIYKLLSNKEWRTSVSINEAYQGIRSEYLLDPSQRSYK